MQQFRPHLSFDKNGGANQVGAQFSEGFVEDSAPFQPRPNTADLSFFINTGQQPAPAPTGRNTGRQPAPIMTSRTTGQQPVPRSTTDQLAAFAKNAQPTPTTGYLSLAAALQSTMTGKTTRTIVIPGAKKSPRTDARNSIGTRRMSKRLRHAIIIIVCVLIILVTLLTLTPLATGQGGIPGVNALGNWMRTAQLVWNVQAHQSDVATPPPVSGTGTGATTANPPPIQVPTSQYVAIAQQDAIAAGISPTYFVRQIYKESSFNPNAVSPSGAVGIAQFLPSTAAGLGINPWDPIQALRGAANVMAGYSRMYGGDYAKALAAYNAGSGTVQYAVNTCGANWMNCLPAETRNYIYQIMGI